MVDVLHSLLLAAVGSKVIHIILQGAVAWVGREKRVEGGGKGGEGVIVMNFTLVLANSANTNDSLQRCIQYSMCVCVCVCVNNSTTAGPKHD